MSGVVSTVKTLCPPGFFCPPGTGYDLNACPPGTYNDLYGLSEVEQCKPCDPGKFCRGTNLTAPSGQCEAGYFCSRGVSVPNPIIINRTYCPANFTHLVIGDICPRGYYCPKGSDMYKGTLWH